MDESNDIVVRDFNTPLLASEKKGWLPHDVDSRKHLANLIMDLALVDVDFGGCEFT